MTNLDLSPFHARYSREAGGMTLVSGKKNPKLLSDLEVFGSGLETKGPLSGGPLFVRFQDLGTALAWIKGIPHERPGVWEAKGVIAELDTQLIEAWPKHWRMLQSLDLSGTAEDLRLQLEKKGYKSDELPPPPKKLSSLLTSYHLQNAQSQTNRFRIPMSKKEDLDLLPWLWLLGPVSIRDASVGPPLHIPSASQCPITYEGELIGVGSQVEFPEPCTYIEDIIERVRKGDFEKGTAEINKFRKMQTDERIKILKPRPLATATPPLPPVPETPEPVAAQGARRWLRPVFGSPASRAERINENQGINNQPPEGVPGKKPPSKRSKYALIKLGLNSTKDLIRVVALQNVLIIALLINFGIISSLAKEEQGTTLVTLRPNPEKKGGEVGTNPSSASTAASSRILERRLNLQCSQDFQSILKRLPDNLADVEDTDIKTRLTGAAVQIFLVESGCAKPDEIIIDGILGAKARPMISTCNGAKSLDDNQSEALRWLSSWLQTGR